MSAQGLLRTQVPGEIVDFAPLEELPGSQWLLLRADGRLLRLDAEDGAVVDVAMIDVTELPVSERKEGRWQVGPGLRLHASSCGAFAAVVVDGGRHGVIVDLTRGATTLRMQCGDYLPDTVPFSFAFVVVRGRTLAVHRSEWNRLDLSDPATGELLSVRDTPPIESIERPPPHYLDYFHGALHASPSGRLLLDDGWLWHPLGVTTVVDCEAWLHDNPFETEDGSSRREVAVRDEWLPATAWIDDRLVVAIGAADVGPGPGVFDIEEREPARKGDQYWPAARVVSCLPQALAAERVFADATSVFTVAAAGTRRWSLPDGACIAQLPDFHPTRFHRARGELAQFVDGALLRSPQPRGST